MDAAHALLELALGGIANSMGKPDWFYRDLPRMTPEYYDKFVSLVGEENLEWITQADYGDTKRGQVLISPAGIERIREYNRTENPGGK